MGTTFELMYSLAPSQISLNAGSGRLSFNELENREHFASSADEPGVAHMSEYPTGLSCPTGPIFEFPDELFLLSTNGKLHFVRRQLTEGA